MSDQLSNFMPWVSFIAGLGGSLHCVGMCGGLVAASCEKSGDVFRYQVGRLIGYVLLGAIAGTIGSWVNITSFPQISLITGVSIGLLFIYWGVQNFRGKKAEIPVPKFLGKIYSRLWHKLVHKNKTFTRAFFTGLISIILPCGLLYGIVIGTVALENRGLAMTSMFFFWLGTVPGMVAAPGIIQKVLNPLRSKLPKTYALTLVTIGIMTISFRVAKMNHMEGHRPGASEATHKSCH